MMKTAENKTTASNTLQRKGTEPLFQKENGGQSFFSGVKNTATQEPFFKPSVVPKIQAKLKIGAPDDHYEREADSMADKVVQRLAESNGQLAVGNEQSEPSTVRRAPLTVQRKCAACEQEEKLQKKEDEIEKAPEQVQMKPIFDSAAEPPPNVSPFGGGEGGGISGSGQGGGISDGTGDEIRRKPIFESNQEEMSPNGGGQGGDIQRKCADCEQEGEIQRESDASTASEASPDVASRLSTSKGGGSPLPDKTRSDMEGAFGADFSSVRVHTGSEAAGMSKDLHAQAFTHGSDIYFNEGKYSPGSSDGQKLLAHELTHTVQQGGGIKKKNKCGNPLFSKSKNKIEYSSELPGQMKMKYLLDFRPEVKLADGMPLNLKQTLYHERNIDVTTPDGGNIHVTISASSDFMALGESATNVITALNAQGSCRVWVDIWGNWPDGSRVSFISMGKSENSSLFDFFIQNHEFTQFGLTDCQQYDAILSFVKTLDRQQFQPEAEVNGEPAPQEDLPESQKETPLTGAKEDQANQKKPMKLPPFVKWLIKAAKVSFKNLVNFLWGFIWGEPAFKDVPQAELYAFIGDVVAGILIYGDIRDIVKHIIRLIRGEGEPWENWLIIGACVVGLVPLFGDILKPVIKGGIRFLPQIIKALRWISSKIGFIVKIVKNGIKLIVRSIRTKVSKWIKRGQKKFKKWLDKLKKKKRRSNVNKGKLWEGKVIKALGLEDLNKAASDWNKIPGQKKKISSTNFKVVDAVDDKTGEVFSIASGSTEYLKNKFFTLLGEGSSPYVFNKALSDLETLGKVSDKSDYLTKAKLLIPKGSKKDLIKLLEKHPHFVDEILGNKDLMKVLGDKKAIFSKIVEF